MSKSEPERISKASEARKRLASQARQKAEQALEEMVSQGLHKKQGGISVSSVAKHAGVSRNLIYGMPELITQIQTLRDQQPSAPRKAGNSISVAHNENYKIKLAHASKEIERLSKEKARLQRTLARTLDERPDGGAEDESESLLSEIARLSSELIAERNSRERLDGELAELQEEHTASRERNRELTREVMRLRQELMDTCLPLRTKTVRSISPTPSVSCLKEVK